MKVIKDVLAIALLGSLLACVLTVGAHLRGWTTGMDNMLERSQNTVGNVEATSAAVAKAAPPLMASLDQGGQKMQMAFDSLQLAADKSNDVLDNVRDVTGELVSFAGSGTKLIDHATEQLDGAMPRIDKAIDQVETLPAHITPLLDNTAELTNSLNDFAQDKKTAELRDNASQFLGNSARLIGNADHAFFPGPYTGTHPKTHAAITIGKSILGIGGRIAEPAYYTKGALGK
jgi:ABC-type transporter Mla subunit MlaD